MGITLDDPVAADRWPLDGDLIARAVRGDADAWETLYRRTYPVVTSFSRRRLPPEEAGDAVAETFLRALRGLDRFDGTRNSLEAFLRGGALGPTPGPHRAMSARPEPTSEPAVLDVRSAAEWETWLTTNHEAVPAGVWLRLFKKGQPEATLTYSDAVDVALCFGWIDGQGRKYDDVSRLTRFTPRRRRSGWSKLNTQRVARLTDAGRMRAAGLREVDAAKSDGRWEQAYDPPSTAEVPADFMAALGKNKKAAAFFATLTKRNTYPVVYRLQTAKTPETRAKRIKAMIDMFERGEKFHP